MDEILLNFYWKYITMVMHLEVRQDDFINKGVIEMSMNCSVLSHN